MANIYDKTKDMIGNIGALQTLAEKFPMKLISFDNINFSSSFDVLGILFKILKIDREELIEVVTDALDGDGEGGGNTGFIANAEEIIKMALETNIINILNCTTNPIISNEYMDEYTTTNTIKKNGTGIIINLDEIDFTGTLKRNPCEEINSKFFFDVSGYTVNDVYKSQDFNAYLWWVVNKGTAEHSGSTWDDRYRASIYGKKRKGEAGDKKIIKCNYIDNVYPKNDSIIVHLCGETYHKKRKIVKIGGNDFSVNKTIFEFNHDFLSSVKLFDPKVFVAEVVNSLLGVGNVSLNIGVSMNDFIINERVNQIIDKTIKSSDIGSIDDCFFSFSNDEYNEMLEKSEEKRYGVINTGTEYVEIDPIQVLNKLSGATDSGSASGTKAGIKAALTEFEKVVPARDPGVESVISLNYDWQTELMRMLVYPLVRPLFSPKILFLLVLNKKVMGSIEDIEFNNINEKFEKLLSSLWFIIKDIVVKMKDMVVEMLLKLVMNKIQPLLELFASRLLAESLKMYKDLLTQLLEECLIGWDNNGVVGSIDNVNYADIKVSSTPEINKQC